jgi:hypothetical protein
MTGAFGEVSQPSEYGLRKRTQSGGATRVGARWMSGPAGDGNGRQRSQEPKIPNEPNFTGQPKENKADIGLASEPNRAAASGD